MTFEEMQLLLQSIAVSQRETIAIVESNSRTIQAMLEQAATDRLKRDEERIEHQRRIELLEANNEILANTQQGIAALLGSMDEDRPTILRKLNTIEQKTDSILSRLPSNN
jgi:enoyl reductase-like protein